MDLSRGSITEAGAVEAPNSRKFGAGRRRGQFCVLGVRAAQILSAVRGFC
jgi:hypothetical protein